MAEIPFQNENDAPVFVIPAEALREELEELESLRATVERVRELLCADPDLSGIPGRGYVLMSRIERALDGEA